MKLQIRPITVLVMSFVCTACSATASAQWYVNPQSGAGGNGTNAMNYATNSLLYGNGLVPGSNLFPGNGALSAGGSGVIPNGNNTGTAESTDSGDGGGPATGASYGFTSDPVSAYTNAVYTGMANVIRSEGSYNRETARGMIDYEKARSLYAQNQAQIFSVRRAIYRAKLAAHAEDLEYEHAALARSNAFMAAHRPLPLDSRHLDSSTGSIRWPALLMQPEFEDLRQQIEADFEGRAKDGYDSDKSIDMKARVRELRDRLHDEVLKHPLEHYSVARRFLDQLLASAE